MLPRLPTDDRRRELCMTLPSPQPSPFEGEGALRCKVDYSARPKVVESLQRQSRLLGPALIVLVAVFHLTTLRSGHDWGGDFALYILHAQNIVEGQPYAQTPYIYNPHYPQLSPRAYPPVYPLMLAPLYAAYGSGPPSMKTITAMQVQLICIFVAWLAVIWWSLKDRLSPLGALGLIAALGFSPYLWLFKHSILSDIPFAMFVYVSLWLIDRFMRADAPMRRRIVLAVGAGLAMYLASATRSGGWLLPLGLLIYMLIWQRGAWKPTLIAIATFLAPALVQMLLLATGADYADQFAGYAFGQILVNAINHWHWAATLWHNGYADWLMIVVFYLFAALAVLGYIASVRQPISIYELFAPLYLLAVPLFPVFEPLRYLIPLLPLYIFYILIGAESLQIGQRRMAAAGTLVVLLIILLTYTARYTKQDFGPQREGIAVPTSTELFDYVRQRTEPDDVFVFVKPRVLALMTGRRCAAWQLPANMPSIEAYHDDLWRYFRQIDARYLIVTAWPPFDRQLMMPFVQRSPATLHPVLSNRHFNVYRIGATKK